MEGHAECVRLLLDSGADTEVKDLVRTCRSAASASENFCVVTLELAVPVLFSEVYMQACLSSILVFYALYLLLSLIALLCIEICVCVCVPAAVWSYLQTYEHTVLFS